MMSSGTSSNAEKVGKHSKVEKSCGRYIWKRHYSKVSVYIHSHVSKLTLNCTGLALYKPDNSRETLLLGRYVAIVAELFIGIANTSILKVPHA